MKLKITLVVILFALMFNAKAQFTKIDANVTECNPTDMLSVIGQDNNAFYIYKNDLKAKQISIQRFNKKSFVKEWETALSLQVSGRGGKFTCLKNNQICVYLPVENNDKEVLLLYVIGIDGKVITDTKVLYSVDDKGNQNRYDYAVSPDSSKFLFCHSMAGATKIIVFDVKTANILFDKSIPSVYQGSSVKDVLNYSISNNGKIAYTFYYALGVKEPTILEDGNGYGAMAKYANFWNHHDQALAIGIYNPVNGEVTIKTPNLGAEPKTIGSYIGLNFTDSKLLVIATAQETKYSGKGNSGVYIAQIDINKYTIDSEGFQFFSEAWKDKYAGINKWASNREYKFNSINGEGTVITSFGATHLPQNNIWASDGMVIKINAQGKTEWMKVLPMGIRTNGNYVNYTCYNKKMYYFFNDNEKNEKGIDINNVEGSKETKPIGRAFGDDVNTICISYDISGNAQRSIIQNNKDFALSPLDRVIFLEKNKILLYFKKENQGKFSSLTIQ